MAQGNLKDALQYASQNPTSDFALKLGNVIKSGQVDNQAKDLGIDLTPIKRTFTEMEIKQQTTGNQFDQKPTAFLGKARDFITGIIGGGKLAEGTGLALAAPEVQNTLNTQYDRLSQEQSKLIQQRADIKKSGGDITSIDNALRTNSAELLKLADTNTDFANKLPNAKEIFGSAARLAGTIAGGAITSIASKLTGASDAVGIISGATRGAGAGAIAGATEGTIQGAGLAAEQNKSTEDILASGGLGAITGATVGGVIGGVTGGITGRINANKITADNFHTQLASEPLSPKERADAIYQGKLKDPGLFKKAELEISTRDKQLGDSIKGIVNPKATLSENIDAIRNKVSETDNAVSNYIEKNKVPFNYNQLKTKLASGKDELKLIFASDANAEKTYNAVSDAFVNNVKNGDTLGLFNGRKTFDQLPAIKKLLSSDKLGENARKEIVLSVRKAANEYIASLLPNGNPYKASMLSESRMLEALGNIATKSQNIIGKNKLQILTQQYPLLKWIIGGFATGLVGAAGVGVGNSIVSSTD